MEKAVGGLSGKRIALLGLTFKPGTDDLRHSPALRLFNLLADGGADVVGFDPLLPPSAWPSGGPPRAGTAGDAFFGADAAVIATACPEFRALDWTALAACMRAPIIVDGRNALRGLTLPEGVIYLPVGRLVGNRGDGH
jgi:UDPglucose 6-dehydrogenase